MWEPKFEGYGYYRRVIYPESMMIAGLPWWQWRPAAVRLTTWIHAILGNVPRYKIKFDETQDTPGRQYPALREIVLNPLHWEENQINEYKRQSRIGNFHQPFGPELSVVTLQWVASKGVAAHEVGHARFSSGDFPPTELQMLILNILEDERIERCMTHVYPVLRHHFQVAGDICWCGQHPTNPHSDEKDELGKAIVLYRFEYDNPDVRPKIMLSPTNQEIWEKVKPWIHRAWRAPNTKRVSEIADKIIEIIGWELPETSQPDPLSQPCPLSNTLEEMMKKLADKMPERNQRDGEPEEAPFKEEEGEEEAGGEENSGKAEAEDELSSAGNSGEEPGNSDEEQGNSGEEQGEDITTHIAAHSDGEIQKDPEDKGRWLDDDEIADMLSDGEHSNGDDHTHGYGGTHTYYLMPTEYTDLYDNACGPAEQLSKEILLPAPDTGVGYRRHGRRLSVRRVIYDLPEVFATHKTPDENTPPIVVDILGDRSGSMGRTRVPYGNECDLGRMDPKYWSGKIQSARLGVAILHLAMEKLRIPHAIHLFDDIVACKGDYDRNSEMTLAKLAGWQGVCGQENITLAMEHRLPKLLARAEPIKVMLIIHDGHPVARNKVYGSDWDGILETQKKYDTQVWFIGIYLGPNQDEAARMNELFKNFIHATPETLPKQLGIMLKQLWQAAGGGR